MTGRILITGSSGLVGEALRHALTASGFVVDGLDILAIGSDKGDVKDLERVQSGVADCDGVIHLAAVSRVVWGERDPDLCWATNVGGMQNVLDAAFAQPSPPWIVFSSSREVYGQPDRLPVTEDFPLHPVNVYASTKVESERLMAAARKEGLRASVVRLSNVYGATSDHEDRVIPAFARAAVLGTTLRVDGADHTFDFTHRDDTARGLVALVRKLMDGGEAPPPLHFVTGTPTTLGELAALAIELASSDAPIRHAPPRKFDVARFYGSPEQALRVLDWTPRVSLRDGLARLIADFRRELIDQGAGEGAG